MNLFDIDNGIHGFDFTKLASFEALRMITFRLRNYRFYLKLHINDWLNLLLVENNILDNS
jgi:hypothetical protein